jgi:hypothetical protein
MAVGDCKQVYVTVEDLSLNQKAILVYFFRVGYEHSLLRPIAVSHLKRQRINVDLQALEHFHSVLCGLGH